jgi:folate-dependent phosphoribosylglycinamide formyltransferase PurN
MEQGFLVGIALAVFTREDCSALILAQDLGIPTVVIKAADMAAFETEALKLCKERNICLIALTGFMKQLSAQFIEQAGIPVLNVHPALLPKYGGKGMYGLAVHNAVWEAGDKISGATVHHVDPLYDNGRIIAQSVVDISQCASPEDISKQVLSAEHELYPHSIFHYLRK